MSDTTGDDSSNVAWLKKRIAHFYAVGSIVILHKLKNMPFKYTYYAKGKPVGVFIPINEWEQISNELSIKKSKKAENKSIVLNSIKKGMKQVMEIEQKKIKSIPLKDLLDDL